MALAGRMTVVIAALIWALSVVGCGGGDPVVGDWELDQDALQESITEAAAAEGGMGGMGGMAEGGMNPADMMGAMMAEMFKDMSITMSINADGTFTGTSTMNGITDNVDDTWTVSNGTYSFTADGETVSATISGGAMNMDMDGAPFDMVMKKK